MKTVRTLVFLSIAAVLSACGSNFEWFPKAADTLPPGVSDTLPPGVTATVASNSTPNASTTLFNNRTTHLPSLPASVTFSTDKTATIYYTINGSTPTTASSSVTASTGTKVTGPSITATNTVLMFFGIDTLSNKSTIQTSTIVSP